MPDYSSKSVDLVTRLRYWEGEYQFPAGLMLEAADAIEVLRLRNRALKNVIDQVRRAMPGWLRRRAPHGP